MLRKVIFLALCAAAIVLPGGRCCAGVDPAAFANPTRESRPWTYWLWQNGNVDEEDVTRDLEAIKRLGFGGVLMFDNRGYGYEDGMPPVKLQVMTEEWFGRVAFAIRECARLGLEFEMNASSSGGSLCGFADGKFYEVDITDPAAVSNHLERFVGPIIRRVPEAVGSTFTHIYSVSWEGRVPPSVKPAERDAFILRNFYGVMREWAHAHGLKMSAESGGPWHRTPGHFAESDQLAYLGVNDLPQGEFWPQGRLLPWCTPMHLVKPVASAAHVRGLRRVSVEAFTHMTHHWSMDPAALKKSADDAFADGANHFVWHTFTCSPPRFGVPGAEYFAGSHINQNVTWHADAGAFVDYLARCQYMLQYGEPVADLAVNGGDRPYLDWGHHRLDGHDWDLLDDADYRSLRREGDRIVLPSGRSYPATLPAPDCEGCEAFAHRRGEADDCDVYFLMGPAFRNVTLRAPLGKRRVELWDPVTGRRTTADARRFRDGRTRVALDLPRTGSIFVVFAPAGIANSRVEHVERAEVWITNSWHVSFAYHDGISAAPPAPVEMATLREWTACGRDGEAASTSLRYFSGTATYRTTVIVGNNTNNFKDNLVLDGSQPRAGSKTAHSCARNEESCFYSCSSCFPTILSLGELPSGLAHVFVNGRDCGVVWCAPWETDVSSALREGENELEIRYTNNWHNRLIGDCALKPEERVTRTTVRLTTEKRDEFGDKLPYSRAVSAHDPLLPSGLLGPVKVICEMTRDKE